MYIFSLPTLPLRLPLRQSQRKQCRCMYLREGLATVEIDRDVVTQRLGGVREAAAPRKGWATLGGTTGEARGSLAVLSAIRGHDTWDWVGWVGGRVPSGLRILGFRFRAKLVAPSPAPRGYAWHNTIHSNDPVESAGRPRVISRGPLSLYLSTDDWCAAASCSIKWRHQTSQSLQTCPAFGKKGSHSYRFGCHTHAWGSAARTHRRGSSSKPRWPRITVPPAMRLPPDRQTDNNARQIDESRNIFETLQKRCVRHIGGKYILLRSLIGVCRGCFVWGGPRLEITTPKNCQKKIK